DIEGCAEGMIAQARIATANETERQRAVERKNFLNEFLAAPRRPKSRQLRRPGDMKTHFAARSRAADPSHFRHRDAHDLGRLEIIRDRDRLFPEISIGGSRPKFQG